MFEVFSLSVLAFSLFPISDASSISTNTGLDPEFRDTAADTLGPVSEVHVVNGFVAPDGFNRSASLVNGVYPGPLIKANKGEHFAIKVFNELTDPSMYNETSIHWHGISQHVSNWADGVAYITQCPLRQQEAFTHRFVATDQTGTYWYHSHYGTQYCDGVRGPLVIYDPLDPLAHLYDVDDGNTVITLSDWYHSVSPILADEFQAILSNATLINGLGRYAGGPATPLAVINVKPGVRYRYRLIAMSCDPTWNFSIDGHTMSIIEVDGVEVLPVQVDQIPMFAGQRYSVIVTANQPVGNYWIRALPTDIPGASFEGGQNSGILRYVGAPNQDPTSPPGPYNFPFDEGKLHPLILPGAPGLPIPGRADVNLRLTPGFNFSNRMFEVNGVTFENPTVPVLLQILSGARHPSELLPSGSIYELPPNKVVEIAFPNPTGAFGFPHPLHLHGHNFDVVRVAGSNTYNFLNPVRRDVVSIGGSATDEVTIRFVTDNPGPWFLHCHIDWHLNHGFAVVLAEAPDLTAAEQAAVVPADWTQLCNPNALWGQTVLGPLGTYV